MRLATNKLFEHVKIHSADSKPAKIGQKKKKRLQILSGPAYDTWPSLMLLILRSDFIEVFFSEW